MKKRQSARGPRAWMEDLFFGFYLQLARERSKNPKSARGLAQTKSGPAGVSYFFSIEQINSCSNASFAKNGFSDLSFPAGSRF